MILRLALKDIVHDWLLSTCLVLAIASIIAPLLILFGLKFGTVQTMRGRLIEDPKNREIRPLMTKSFEKAWFDNLRSDIPEIAFIVPMTRQISTSITATNSSKGARDQLGLIATADGDPLLLENGVIIPKPGSCVLTEPAAQSLQVAVGDELIFSARRIVHDKSESGDFTVRIAGILESRASSLKTAFVPLDVVEAVEDYKDGRAVPVYGWEGTLPEAYPVFDGVSVSTPSPLSKIDEVVLTNNTGFTQVKKIDANKVIDKLGFKTQQDWATYLLTVKQHAATEESIQAVRNKLRGREATVVPWIDPLDITLTSPAQAQSVILKLYTVSEEIDAAIASHLPATVGGKKEKRQPLLIPSNTSLNEGEATLSLQIEDRQITMPVTLIQGGDSPSIAYTNAAFAGKLNLLRSRNIKYDEHAGELLLSRSGYAGFRLYAKNIDDVATIKRKIENQGVQVNTEQERIEEVRRLDKYMGLIFWLIAAVGVIGGIAALTASLYASVERKKRELNVLRLLGLLKREIVLFPVLQGLILSGSALIVAGSLFLFVAALINQLFRAHLRTTESLCTLSFSHFMLLVVGVSALSIVSAAFAALQATRLDPAEALRDE